MRSVSQIRRRASGLAVAVVVAAAAVAAAAIALPIIAAAAPAADGTDRPGAHARDHRPNVLLVTVDTLRWDALGSYGARVETPALDGLAAQGARFEYAAAHAVTTLPSHTSILTGLDPSRHGVHDNAGYRAGDDLVTWAERFRDGGYATGAFVGAFPLDSLFGLAQGFDVYDDYYGESGSMGDFAIVERPAGAVVEAARGWIREQDRPWFAWVHVYDPHSPYEPPPPFDVRYAEMPYAGEVAAADTALAPLLEEALDGGALVVATSDHGESLGEHGEGTHGVFAYDATLRVPLIVAWPGHVVAGRVVTDPAHHVDLLPTVLDLVGLPRHDGLAGVSLVAILGDRTGTSMNVARAPGIGGGDTDVADDDVDARGPGAEPDDRGRVYFEALTTYLARNWAPLRGIYDGRWKLIDLPLPELYDTLADPGEVENLADSDPARVAALRQRLRDHVAGSEDEAVGAPQIEDAETIARLQALGYVGTAAGGPRDRVFGPEDDPKNLIQLDTAMQEAAAAGRAGDLDRAAAMLEAIIDRRSDFTHAYTLLGFIESQRGNVEAAIGQLERAREQGLEDGLLLTRLGSLLRDAGRPEEAVAVLEGALEREPDNLEMINLLGMVYDESGRTTEALTVFSRGIEIDATYPSLLANHAALLIRLGRLGEARAMLERAVTYDPGLATAHNALGVVAAQSGRLPEAVEHWRRALSLDPGNHDVRYNLGITLTRLNRFAEAIPVLEAFVEQAPPDRYADDIAGVRRLLQRLRER